MANHVFLGSHTSRSRRQQLFSSVPPRPPPSSYWHFELCRLWMWIWVFSHLSCFTPWLILQVCKKKKANPKCRLSNCCPQIKRGTEMPHSVLICFHTLSGRVLRYSCFLSELPFEAVLNSKLSEDIFISNCLPGSSTHPDCQQALAAYILSLKAWFCLGLQQSNIKAKTPIFSKRCRMDSFLGQYQRIGYLREFQSMLRTMPGGLTGTRYER